MPSCHKQRKNTLVLPEHTVWKSRHSTGVIPLLTGHIICIRINQLIVAPEHDTPSVAIAHTEADSRQHSDNAADRIVTQRVFPLHVGRTNLNICERKGHRTLPL